MPRGEKPFIGFEHESQLVPLEEETGDTVFRHFVVFENEETKETLTVGAFEGRTQAIDWVFCVHRSLINFPYNAVSFKWLNDVDQTKVISIEEVLERYR